jgi:hypothetical protein
MEYLQKDICGKKNYYFLLFINLFIIQRHLFLKKLFIEAYLIIF